jgi:hypothetical protein
MEHSRTVINLNVLRGGCSQPGIQALKSAVKMKDYNEKRWKME